MNNPPNEKSRMKATRRKWVQFVRILMVTVSTIFSLQAAFAQDYPHFSFYNIFPPFPPASISANAINSSGVVAGTCYDYYLNFDQVVQFPAAFTCDINSGKFVVYTNFTDQYGLPAITRANAINDNGEWAGDETDHSSMNNGIVGLVGVTSTTNPYVAFGLNVPLDGIGPDLSRYALSFIYNSTNNQILQVIDNFNGYAFGINNAGTVCGASQNIALRPCIWHSGVATFLSDAGSGGVATAINQNGFTAGYIKIAGKQTACFWSGTDCYTIDNWFNPPYNYAGGVVAVNNLGDMVGWVASSNGVQHACEWTHDGYTYDFNVFGGQVSVATGINDFGWVVGTYVDSNLNQHSFLYDGSDGYIYERIFDDQSGESAYGQWLYPQAINNSFQVAGYFSGQEGAFVASLTAGKITNSVALDLKISHGQQTLLITNLYLGEKIILETSTNLQVWTALQTNIVDTSAEASFTYPMSFPDSIRYFRAKVH